MLKKLFFNKKALFFPGCTVKTLLPQIYENYLTLLKDLDINFVELKLKCCGYPALYNGYQSDFESLMKENLEILKKNKINYVITPDPHCLNMFKEHYKIESYHISEILSKHLGKIDGKKKKKAQYHDPCFLTKKDKISKEPRKALNSAGYLLIPLPKEKDKTFCCGAGGCMRQNSPKIAAKVAKERCGQFSEKNIITSCPLCYIHLKENKKQDQNILEFSEGFME